MASSEFETILQCVALIDTNLTIMDTVEVYHYQGQHHVEWIL